MKQKGLGTGLGALFGDAAFDREPTDFEYVPISRIAPNPEQPRVKFEREKIDSLADSIREHGVLVPVTVRLVDGVYQIVAGERRWRAAREAGLNEMPVRVVEADDKKAMELALVENLQREDLNPAEEARGYRVLMDEFGMTQEEVAQKVSKSRPAVANSLRLLTLSPELIQYVESGEISAGSARALLSLRDPEQRLSAAQTIINRGMSVREVEAYVKKLDSPPRVKEQADVSDNEVDYLLDAQHRLTKALGRKVMIKQQKDKGKVEIEYYNLDDFNELFSTLVGGDSDE